MAKHIEPYLGSVPVSKLTPTRVDAWIARLSRQGVGDTTVRRAHAVLRMALAQAVRWEWTSRNVAERANLPREPVRSKTIPTGEEIPRLLCVADARHQALGTIVRLCAAAGLRRGEALALRWDHVDFGAGTLLIAGSTVDVKGKPVLKDTKTHRIRAVNVGHALIAHLEFVQACQHKEALVAGVEQGKWVCAEVAGHEPFKPDRASKAFKAVTQSLGMNAVTLHSLRHFYGTHLVADGHSAVDISKLMGHSSPTVTLGVYAHALPAGRKAAADSMDRFLG